MSSMPGCREIRQALGVYVLGAIDPAERSQVDAHLATCPECREELASLAGLPALLRRVPFAEAERLALVGPGGNEEPPPAELLQSLLARAGRVHHARRWRGLVAAAAVAVLALGAGAATASAMHLGGGSRPVAQEHMRWQKVSATNPATGVTLTVKYAPMAWGTRMSVQVSGPRPGVVCQFEVTDSSGHRWIVGGWKLSYRGGPAWYPASTWISDAHVRSFELTSDGRVLAQVKAS